MGAEKDGGGKGEGEKKPAPAAGGGEKKDDGGGKVVSVYKMDMHCEGCAKKIRRALKQMEGVEDVKTDCSSNKLTVTGKVDPGRVKARVEEKTKKKVDIVSPQPKKEGGGGGGGGGAPPAGEKKGGGGGGEKAEKKAEEKKPEEKKPAPPKESTVVLKIRTHCDGCIHKMKKIILKIKGVASVAVDGAKDLVTVKGTMDVKELAPYLREKLKRTVDVVPPPAEKKDAAAAAGGGGGEKKDNKEKGKEGGGGGGGGQAPKGEKKEGDGGGKKVDAAAAPAGGGGGGGAAKVEVNKMEYYGSYPPAAESSYWAGEGSYGQSSYYVEPRQQMQHYAMEPQYAQHGYAPMMMNAAVGGGGYGGYGHHQEPYMMGPPAPAGYPMMVGPQHPGHAPQFFSDENPNACSLM
ncbi:unnamed protein product [Linum tenue]|uniref:HMA domain-containing protein n=1 Tax=Linum tenue TaxID=586396 RepID=A0AAV0PF03_9ROSI|nr:unnamed protein product [Linum tenue]